MHIYISGLLILSSLILVSCNDPSSTPKYRTEWRVTTIVTKTQITPDAITIDDSTGDLYVVEVGAFGSEISKITSAGVVSPFGRGAKTTDVRGITARSGGELYATDTSRHSIYKITTPTTAPAGLVTLLAGSDTAGTHGSTNGNGVAARFNSPLGITIDSAGILYVADTENHTIRKITPTGEVTTIAGTAVATGSTDGNGAIARFNRPSGICIDSAGMLYVVDSANHTIRKITPAGEVTTIAGTAGTTGSTDGNGAAAQFNTPSKITIDSAGMLYVIDSGNHTIRKITPAGEVTTIAGTAGIAGIVDGTGTAAQFGTPGGITIDSAGILYVGDTGNRKIRKITPVTVKVN